VNLKAWLDKFKPYEVKRARDLRALGRPAMLIDELIPVGSITLISGAAYSRKTWFALEAMRAVATGDKFMGEFEVRSQGNVLLIEQDSPLYDTGPGLWGMLKQMWKEEGDAEREAQGYSIIDPIYSVWHPGVNLLNRADTSRIVATGLSLSTFRGAGMGRWTVPVTNEVGEVIGYDRSEDEWDFSFDGVKLIVLDSSRALHGGDENDSKEMETVIQNLKYIRQHTNAAIILIAHDGATGLRTRGSTAWDGGVDVHYNVIPNKSGYSTLAVRKARAIAPREFRYTVVTTPDPDGGVPIKEVRFLQYADASEEVDLLNPKEEQLLAYIEGAADGIEKSRLAEWASLQGVSERTVDRWLSALVEKKVIARTERKEGRTRVAVYTALVTDK